MKSSPLYKLIYITICSFALVQLINCEDDANSTENIHISKVIFNPSLFDDLQEDQSKLVNIFYLNASDGYDLTTLRFDVKSTDDSVVDVSQVLNQFQTRIPGNFTITLTPKKLGKASLVWRLYHLSSNETIDHGSFIMSVARPKDRIQMIFTIFVAILVSINNVNMGCFIDLGTIKRVLEKPVAPAIGFFCQFLFMPIASFIIGLSFFPDNMPWRIGLFTLGCCPGGTGSNFWTLLFDGDVDLSITMTFISTLAAMAMMPLWIFSLGRLLFQQPDVQIPYVNLLSSLLILALSLAIGIAIQKISPNCAKFLKKYLKTFTLLVIIVVIVGGTYVSYYIFAYLTVKVVIAGLTAALGGYLFGALVAIAFELPREQIIAVSIETALQNPGIAFVLIQLSLHKHDSDLAIVPVVGQLFMTGIPLWLGYCVYFILTRFRVFEPVSQLESRDDDKDKNEPEEEDEFNVPDTNNSPDENKSRYSQIVIMEPRKIGDS